MCPIRINKKNKGNAFTLQLCLWDTYRRLSDEADPMFPTEKAKYRASYNLGKLTSFLIRKECLSIAILKAIDIQKLRISAYRFLLLYMKTLFVDFYTVYNKDEEERGEREEGEEGEGEKEEKSHWKSIRDNDNYNDEEWITAIDRIKQVQEPLLVKNFVYLFLKEFLLHDINDNDSYIEEIATKKEKKEIKKRIKATLKGLDRLTLHLESGEGSFDK